MNAGGYELNTAGTAVKKRQGCTTPISTELPGKNLLTLLTHLHSFTICLSLLVMVAAYT